MGNWWQSWRWFTWKWYTCKKCLHFSRTRTNAL